MSGTITQEEKTYRMFMYNVVNKLFTLLGKFHIDTTSMEGKSMLKLIVLHKEMHKHDKG